MRIYIAKIILYHNSENIERILAVIVNCEIYIMNYELQHIYDFMLKKLAVNSLMIFLVITLKNIFKIISDCRNII
ncbi:hypothetical protein CDIOL_07520 [Clostridium diolis]|uniref:Uncharacterized protein n=1 Tax=Clostridium diolis TaxID=223919 RepID=A0AAV3VYI0_9CLOT|nr:hypothetical protein CDIOL_07520 [Clostridium diolis]